MNLNNTQFNKPASSALLNISPHNIPTLSIIIAYYNEAEVLAECHQKLTEVLNTLNLHCEIIYIDDGSSDNSWTVLHQALISTRTIHAQPRSDSTTIDINNLRLSRNFGKEAAMCAGLEQSTGKAVILLDADLQDPPALIPKMLNKWREGYDVVDMQRNTRTGETWLKRCSANIYYKLLNQLSDLCIPKNVGDFRLLDRRVVKQINLLPEKTRYMKGLFAWPGYKRTTLKFDREPRHAGQTKWSYCKLLHLAFEGITSFSTKPLKLASFAGFTISIIALMLAISTVIKTLVYGNPVAGYSSTITIVLMLGGVQLLSIGILGEYIGRIFIESKQRPLYLIMEQQHSFHTSNHQETGKNPNE
ncbi:MAG: glycosyltransferase family 2 protein [Oceanospirillaceae bacterium]